MTEGDFRDQIAQQDFQEQLGEQSTDEIEYQLKVGKIKRPEKVALAEIELKRREEASALAQANRQLEECRQQLVSEQIKVKAIVITAGATLLVAVVAIAAFFFG